MDGKCIKLRLGDEETAVAIIRHWQYVGQDNSDIQLKQRMNKNVALCNDIANDNQKMKLFILGGYVRYKQKRTLKAC